MVWGKILTKIALKPLSSPALIQSVNRPDGELLTPIFGTVNLIDHIL